MRLLFFFGRDRPGAMALVKRHGKETFAERFPSVHRRRLAEEAVAAIEPVENTRVTDFQGYTRELLTTCFMPIMQALVQKSIEGSLSHIKYLFDIAGIKDGLRRHVENDGEPTLGQVLMSEVERYRAEHPHSTEEADAEAFAGNVAFGTTNTTFQAGNPCGAKAQ